LLGYEDILGLRSAFEHFKEEHICFVAPEFLSTEEYETLAEEYNLYVELKRFDNIYFSGKDAYSKLLVSGLFYSCFREYTHMLICQTDAYVFHNKLKEWMGKGYSYIGAPWVERNEVGQIKIIGAGNGGFSLRKISDFIRLTHKIELLKKMFFLWQMNKWTQKISFGMLLRICAAPIWLHCNINKYTFYLAANKLQHEDKYWCVWVAKVFNEFKNAPASLSSRFAIEEEPRYFMDQQDGELPMGCHAWAVINPEFWKQYILK
jgi:hypothetical protein